MKAADWVDRLWRVIEAYENASFEHGRHDCCLFVARCIDAMTGSTFARDLASHYHDEPSARAFLLAEGGMVRGVTRFLGGPSDDVRPRRGDVALVQTEDGEGIGMCVGRTIAVAAQDGLEFYPVTASMRSWRID